MAGQDQSFKTARSRIIKFVMIDFPGSWPKADSARCCIFDAINIVGKAKFGSDWTNAELGALYWHEQPAEVEARRLAMLALLSQRSKPPPPERSIVGRPRGIVVPFDLDQRYHVVARTQYLADLAHQEAVKQEQQLWEDNRSSRFRLEAAVDWIAQQSRDGVLHTYYRFATGGTLFDMAPPDWNVEHVVSAFVSDGGYKRWFIIDGKSKQWPVYIFFDRAQLAKAISFFSHAPDDVETTSLGRLSPYLRLAVKLAIAKGYNSPANADTQAVREAEVEAAWGASLPGVPSSKTAIVAIAKVIGFPNPIAILQGKSRGSGTKG